MKKFDSKLLFLYSENCRKKIKELSSLLNKSSQRLKYSINTLEKERILVNPHTIFDYSYLGLIQFRVYFKGGYIGEKDKNRILKLLEDNPYVTSIYELSGEFDLAIDMICPNPSRFNKELKRIIDIRPTLNNYKIILNVVTHIYPAVYLTKDNRLLAEIKSEIIIGGDRERQEYSENEFKVIKSLLENPRSRMTKISKNSDLNIKTVMNIIHNLEEKKFIRGFKYSLETNNLGFNKHRLFLKLHNINEERESQLIDFTKKTKEIIQVNKTVGDWDMEIDIETPDKTRVRKIIVNLREEFEGLIENFNIMEFIEYYKRSYLPKYVFENKEKE